MQGSNRLAIPHVSVPSIAWLDWDALRRAGFQGCVLDKDNTLTHPYKSKVAPQLLPSLQRCQQAFEGRLALFSNSAGLRQYDPEGNYLLLSAAILIVLQHHRMSLASLCFGPSIRPHLQTQPAFVLE